MSKVPGNLPEKENTKAIAIALLIGCVAFFTLAAYGAAAMLRFPIDISTALAIGEAIALVILVLLA